MRRYRNSGILGCLIIFAIIILGVVPVQASGTTEAEPTVMVVFDPADGVTEYADFYKITIPVGGKVTDKPEDPTRAGYVFEGWYRALDQYEKPIFWDFANDNVQDNTMLWASWIDANEVDDTETATEEGEKKPGPQTGDESNKLIWSVCALGMLGVILLSMPRRTRD